jgi:hypothetical protein
LGLQVFVKDGMNLMAERNPGYIGRETSVRWMIGGQRRNTFEKQNILLIVRTDQL